MDRKRLTFGLGALVLVPVLFGVYVALSYKLALRSGRLPITDESEWIWWSVFGLLLALGVYLVSLSTTGKLRFLLAGLYVVAMAAALLGIHIWVACLNGDCL
jgi:hypothetical protein